MSITRIVTDSTAELDPEIAQSLGITVIPWRLRLGSESVSDGPDYRSAQSYRDMIKRRLMPIALPPTPKQFDDAFRMLSNESDEIFCIHASSQISGVIRVATQARRAFMGRCQIQLLDSQFISRALGIIVESTARAAMDGVSGSELVRYANGLIPITYFAFHVDVPDYLQRSGIMPEAREARTRLARSLLMLEEGAVVPLQRSRRRGTPVERLIEFIAEFQSIHELALLHTGLNPAINEMRELLADALPNQQFEDHVYGPVLFTYIGPTALGVVVHEG